MDEEGLVQLESDELSDEHAVEKWLTKDPGVTIGGIDVFIVDQQGHTDDGQRYDIIGVDRKGETVTIELKHKRSPRKMVAQAFEYASDHYHWERPYSTLEHRFQSYTESTESLRQAHADYFGLDNPRPETAFNSDQQIILLAGWFSDRVLSVAEYLQDTGHSIRCVEYSVYSGDTSRILATQNLLGEESGQDRSENRGKPSPDKKYRTATYRRIFNRIQAEVVPELRGDIDNPDEVLLKPMEELNGLNLISHHPDLSFDHLKEDDDPFAFNFKVVPTKGNLRLSIQYREDEVAEEILESYQDEIEPGFQYKGGKYGAVVKEADIDAALAQINWDTTTREEIAEVLLGDDTLDQYIEEYVEMIHRWHPRIVEEYPEKLAEYEDEERLSKDPK
jgi:hypothetical protein